MGCDESVERFDLRVERCDLFLALASRFASRYRLPGRYCLVELISVGATDLARIVSARFAHAFVRPANAGSSKVERPITIPSLADLRVTQKMTEEVP
jgi:hypothetical protein